MGYRVWVNRLPTDMTPRELRTLFESFGATVRSVTIPERNYVTEGYRYGFVEFERERDQVRVLSRYYVKTLDGRATLRCLQPTHVQAPTASGPTELDAVRTRIMWQQDARRALLGGRTEPTVPGFTNGIPCWRFQYAEHGCAYGAQCVFGHHWRRRANPPQPELRTLFPWTSDGWEEAPPRPRSFAA